MSVEVGTAQSLTALIGLHALHASDKPIVSFDSTKTQCWEWMPCPRIGLMLIAMSVGTRRKDQECTAGNPGLLAAAFATGKSF